MFLLRNIIQAFNVGDINQYDKVFVAVITV